MRTKQEYENYLNGFNMNESDFIMGGKLRKLYFLQQLYGTCLRKYDPIAFNVGFNEFKQAFKN